MICSAEGWDNPFRPDGSLSKEADQIVELIKEGKPITEESLRAISPDAEAFTCTSSHTSNQMVSQLVYMVENMFPVFFGLLKNALESQKSYFCLERCK